MLLIFKLLILDFGHLRIDDFVKVIRLKLQFELAFFLIFILINVQGIFSLLDFVFLHIRVCDCILELLCRLRVLLGDSIKRFLDRLGRFLLLITFTQFGLGFLLVWGLVDFLDGIKISLMVDSTVLSVQSRGVVF